MIHWLGFGLLAVLVGSAIEHLKLSPGFFFDEVAMIVVFGGTLAIALIAFPLRQFAYLFTSPFLLLRSKKQDITSMTQTLVETAQSIQRGRGSLSLMLKREDLPDYLKEGIELLMLDLPRDEFKGILTERIYRQRQRHEDRVRVFRNLAKYPPGLGLVGTVLGLVNVMRSVGGGGTAEVGLKMAVALIATLYGLTLANFYLVPLAEYFQRVADEQKVFEELQFEGLLMIFDNKSGLAVQEMLNAYTDSKKRVDFIGVFSERAS